MHCGAGKEEGETRVGEGIISACFVLLFLTSIKSRGEFCVSNDFESYSTLLYMKPSGSAVVGGGVGPDKRLRVEACPDTRDDNLC